jgi:polyisoprenoid-binding protein YceI
MFLMQHSILKTTGLFLLFFLLAPTYANSAPLKVDRQASSIKV